MRGLAFRLLLLISLTLPVGNAIAAPFQLGLGRSYLIGLLEDLASTGDQKLDIGSIEGATPANMTFRDVTLADRDGIWLRIDRVTLRWSPLALVRRTVEIDRIEVGTVAVLRKPVPSTAPAQPQPSQPGGFKLPELPVTIDLQNFSVTQVSLDPAVLGEAARFSVEGRGRLAKPTQGARLELHAKRSDGVAGTVDTVLEYVPSENRLRLEASVEEPAGGVIARTAAVPGLPPVSVKLEGNGPLSAWKGKLNAQAGQEVGLEAAAQVNATAAGYGITMDASGTVGGLFQPPLRALVEGGVSTSLRASADPSSGRIGIEALTVRTAAAVAAGKGTIDLNAGSLDIGYSVAAGDPAVFAGLAPGASWSDLKIEGKAKGEFARPSIEARLLGERLRFAQIAAERLNLSLTATPSGGERAEQTIGVAGSVAAQSLTMGDPKLDALLAGTVESRFAGSVKPEGGSVALDKFVVTLPFASLEGAGSYDPIAIAASLTGKLAVSDLAAFENLAGMPLKGGALLSLEGEYRVGTVNAKLEGAVTDLKMGQAEAEQALGSRIDIAGEVVTRPDGAIELSRLSVTGAQIQAAASGRLQGDQVEGNWSFDLRDIAAIAPAATGRVSGEGRVSGALADLAVKAAVKVREARVNTIAIARLDLDADVAHLPAAPKGGFKLSGSVAGKPTEAGGRLEQVEGSTRLQGLSLTYASTKLTGDVSFDAAKLITGKLQGRAGYLADLTPLVGQPLSGSADLQLVLNADKGQQNATLSLDGRNIVVAGQTSVRRLVVRGTVSDVTGGASFDGRVEAGALRTGGLDLGMASVTAKGNRTDVALVGKIAGQDLTLETRARIGLEPVGPRIGLAALNGRFKQQPFSLAQPATIAMANGGIAVSNFTLLARPGRVSINGSLTPNGQDLTVTISELPLTLARLFKPEASFAGALNGDIRLAGTRTAPDGRFGLKITNARFGAAPTVPPVNAGFQGTLRNGSFQAAGTMDAGRGGRLALSANLPVLVDRNGVPYLPSTQPIRVEANGGIDLAAINDLLAAGADQVTGRAELQLRIGGTLASLQTEGGLTLANGSYTNVVYGVRLTDIDAALTGSRERLVVTRLSGRTPNGGTVTGSGSLGLNPDEGFPADIRFSSQNAALIANELVSVTADADLTVTGPLMRAPRLAGTVTLDRAEVRVPERLPASIKRIQVTEVNLPPDLAARRKEEEKAAAAAQTMRVGLSIEVKAPGRVYVRGRGINAELGGDLKIGGDSSQPVIVGALNLRRGTLEVVGRRLNFDRGAIAFAGSTDATLDLLATTKADNFTVQVAVTGQISSPQFKLTSQPPLPEDEVLALFLFGKSVGELSALEAIRLGQAAAQLAGLDGGGGVLDKVRDAFGLDRLDIESGSGKGAGAGLSAGRYVSDQVFVGVKQGLEANSSRVTVQVDLTNNIKVESDIGANGGNRVGVNLEWNW